MPGAAGCIANLTAVKNKLNDTLKLAVMDCGNEVMRESQTKYCPRDTGFLMRSGNVSVVSSTATEFVIRLTYTAPYALKQHEMPYHHAVGQWKYLSAPFNAMAPRILKQVETACRSAL